MARKTAPARRAHGRKPPPARRAEPPYNSYRFVDQPAGVAAKVQYHAGDSTSPNFASAASTSWLTFCASKLVIPRYTTPGLQPVGVHYAGLDISARHREGERLGGALPLHGDTHRGCPLPLSMSATSRVHAEGIYPVHGGDDVAAPQPLPCAANPERLVGHRVAAIDGDQHPHAGVLRALFPLHIGVLGGGQKTRVRVQGAQHARYGAVVNARSGDTSPAKLFSMSA